jgi:ABC-type amino acid transport system permease subunit
MIFTIILTVIAFVAGCVCGFVFAVFSSWGRLARLEFKQELSKAKAVKK